MAVLTRMEKMLFPCFLLIFEVVFLVLFGLLVKYDDLAAPVLGNATTHSAGEGHFSSSTAAVVSTYPFFQDVHVMVFIGFGFLMTFLRRYGYSSIGFNFLLAAFVIQWSTVTSGVFTFIDQAKDLCCTIRVGLETLVGSDFAAATVLITMGALLGRVSHFQLIIVAFFEVMFYSANEALNIHVLKAADIGGSMLIHTFGAYFGISASLVLYHQKAKDHPRNSTVYHSDLFSMIGTLFLWLFWPSFNGALAEGDSQYRAIINTYYSMTGSVIASFLFSVSLSGKRKLDITHIQNATLAGGVAVGSVADMVIQPWGAMLIGFCGGFISVVGYKLISPIMEKVYLLDTCGVHNLHGMPGVFSAIASAIAAGVASETGGVEYGQSLFAVFPARAADSGNRHAGIQAGFQLALLASTLAISIFGGLLTGLIVQFLPAFQSTSPSDFYDDAAYWKLSDDADTYLPITDSSTPPPEENGMKKQGHTNPIIELEEVPQSPTDSKHPETSTV